MSVAESSPASMPQQRTVSVSSLYWHGFRAGLLGALVVALWFFFIDYGRGRPLYTPTLLGTQLLGGGGIVPPVLAFTVVHSLVFIVIGVAAGRLVGMLEGGGMRRIGLAAVLLFIILDLGFTAFALTARAIGLEALSWSDVLIGNAFAAAVMMIYLFRWRPNAE